MENDNDIQSEQVVVFLNQLRSFLAGDENAGYIMLQLSQCRRLINHICCQYPVIFITLITIIEEYITNDTIITLSLQIIINILQCHDELIVSLTDLTSIKTLVNPLLSSGDENIMTLVVILLYELFCHESLLDVCNESEDEDSESDVGCVLNFFDFDYIYMIMKFIIENSGYHKLFICTIALMNAMVTILLEEGNNRDSGSHSGGNSDHKNKNNELLPYLTKFGSLILVIIDRLDTEDSVVEFMLDTNSTSQFKGHTGISWLLQLLNTLTQNNVTLLMSDSIQTNTAVTSVNGYDVMLKDILSKLLVSIALGSFYRNHNNNNANNNHHHNNTNNTEEEPLAKGWNSQSQAQQSRYKRMNTYAPSIYNFIPLLDLQTQKMLLNVLSNLIKSTNNKLNPPHRLLSSSSLLTDITVSSTSASVSTIANYEIQTSLLDYFFECSFHSLLADELAALETAASLCLWIINTASSSISRGFPADSDWLSEYLLNTLKHLDNVTNNNMNKFDIYATSSSLSSSLFLLLRLLIHCLKGSILQNSSSTTSTSTSHYNSTNHCHCNALTQSAAHIYFELIHTTSTTTSNTIPSAIAVSSSSQQQLLLPQTTLMLQSLFSITISAPYHETISDECVCDTQTTKYSTTFAKYCQTLL